MAWTTSLHLLRGQELMRKGENFAHRARFFFLAKDGLQKEEREGESALSHALCCVLHAVESHGETFGVLELVR